MRAEVAKDLKWSSRAFVDLVWPLFSPAVGGGELFPVEMSTNGAEFLKKLDQVAGIDGWIVQNNRHMFGIASRVQNAGNFAYKTFTVRTKRPHGKPEDTEYEKRRAQIRTKGSVWPLWTSQAYLDRDTNTVVRAAIAKTEDVIAAVTMGLGWQPPKTYSGEQFWAVPWSHLWVLGYEMAVYTDGSVKHQRQQDHLGLNDAFDSVRRRSDDLEIWGS